jgi:hypothetical protein
MNRQEATSIIQDIITKAQEGPAFSFRTIQYWDEFRFYQKYAKSTKIIIKVLKTSADSLFKDYCRDVIAGISDITKLLAYEQLTDIVAFYENELITFQAMLDDYDDYLGNLGNFISAIFGGERTL